MKGKASQSISSMDRLEGILAETEEELEKIQPEIDKLEKQVEKLKELKLTKQKLITLKLSIKSIIGNFSDAKNPGTIRELLGEGNREILSGRSDVLHSGTSRTLHETSSVTVIDSSRTFLPDRAFDEVNQVLRQKNSLNYEIFRAIVFNGGRATTEQIKAYLVENSITQPTTGEGFEAVELTDISSRVNYLVRKNIVQAAGKGLFLSNFGWQDTPAED